MKRFIAVLAGLLTLPAFADNVPMRHEEGMRTDIISRDVDASVSATAAGRTSKRGTVNRSGVSRSVPTANASVTSRQTNSAAGRVVASTRSAVAVPNSAGKQPMARTANAATVISRNTTLGGRAADAASRAMVEKPSVSSRIRARAASVSVSTPKTDTAVSVSNAEAAPVATAASVTSAMENIASLTTFCKAQYAECMDNFCNVLDDKQGRCSCSKNVKNYEKTETALKTATEALQDVAQQIQYIGLTKDEIDTLFSQTEAELAMQATTDNSQIKNDLDKIKSLIVQVKSGTASSTEVDSGISMDLSGLMNFNISSAGFDLSSMFGTKTANTNSISNQRGEQLYKTAAARCKAAVLKDCQDQGVDISIVSNSYDMEIDKQCVAYERSLTDANEEMNQTVRNAKSVLQRARLMVAQQKNAYDLRGCINALDSCMQDDFVCGNEYENCLDPFGKYIVEGAVVLGSTPGQVHLDGYTGLSGAGYSADGLYSTWNYSSSGNKNAWGSSSGYTEGSLAEYVNATMNGIVTGVGDTMSEYLQYKMGYVQDNKSYGMCAAVLNKCQDYTYSDGEYNPKNRVVEEYLMRTLVKIKNAQDRVISDYAESCIADVQSCLGENNYNGYSTPGDADSLTVSSKIAINACRSQIITCMSVNGRTDAEPSPGGMAEWVNGVMTGAALTEPNACSETLTTNCVITTHMDANGKPACYSDAQMGNNGKCAPTQGSCAQIGGTWLDGKCYCVGGEWADNGMNPTVSYTGFACRQK